MLTLFASSSPNLHLCGPQLLADAIRALTVAQAKALIKDLNNDRTSHAAPPSLRQQAGDHRPPYIIAHGTQESRRHPRLSEVSQSRFAIQESDCCSNRIQEWVSQLILPTFGQVPHLLDEVDLCSALYMRLTNSSAHLPLPHVFRHLDLHIHSTYFIIMA